MVFDYAAYPLALLAFTTVAHFALLVRGRWLLASLAGLAAALTYPLGLVLARRPRSGCWPTGGRRSANGCAGVALTAG